MSTPRTQAPRSLVIVGGGPGGYEAAHVARALGADVTIVERQGLGGSAVLTDVVPSKTLIASADVMTRINAARNLGVKVGNSPIGVNHVVADLGKVHERLLKLAKTQSRDIRAGLESAGVRVVDGTGRLDGQGAVVVGEGDDAERIPADAILVAVGAHPRELPTAVPDGERIFTWTQIYNLKRIPEHLIVVGSGVTGAEFASAYNGLGAKVTLISSRDRVLPGEDADAAEVLESAFEAAGMNVVAQSRAQSVERTEEGVRVTLSTGETIDGSHCLLAVGSIPNTADIGLEEAGVELTESGHIVVDAVSRTSAPGVYAAGDCTGVFPLASVAAMQGRIAVSHFLGDSVQTLKLHRVASNIFTAPEIASVGVSEADVEAGKFQADVYKIPLTTNARAKMMDVTAGFVKILARKDSGSVIGGVVVGPRASELIYPLALAVNNKLHVDDVANTITVYPSLSGSIAEAARRLHNREYE
ncbi:NAD(P)H-quinone dehydrogenase [Falsarthrobacter nasiphocae]|uniref:Dihydrolipoamide dehydrogenase n=1 Tax=Falsarthrobacter nasiphocae TaxID=189863 RepID=A0AAE3YG76_9MICC|nr:NAD(P)H-quinone dehydrogenase [Falsarthrobacter nasiphocae]MDR6891574.1 dihydrolipoamide dehydrogenase [Falsarthrobacter nasiphocae]